LDAQVVVQAGSIVQRHDERAGERAAAARSAAHGFSAERLVGTRRIAFFPVFEELFCQCEGSALSPRLYGSASAQLDIDLVRPRVDTRQALYRNLGARRALQPVAQEVRR